MERESKASGGRGKKTRPPTRPDHREEEDKAVQDSRRRLQTIALIGKKGIELLETGRWKGTQSVMEVIPGSNQKEGKFFQLSSSDRTEAECPRRGADQTIGG